MSQPHITQSNIHFKWSRKLTPALTVASGTEVSFDLRDGGNNQITPENQATILQNLDFGTMDPGFGPVAIEGAEPGDVLRVDILELTPGAYGWTAILNNFGLLSDEFPEPSLKIWDLSNISRDGYAEFKKGIRIPVRPFLGVMGLAPATDEELGTIPPYDWGGNMDCKHITEGATLYLPVQTAGALFSCGDGHAAQGDGEVCGTAIETPMTARLRFTLEKNKPWVRSPHYCTKQGAQSYADRGQEYAVMGLDQDLREATRKALRSAIEWLGAEKGLDRSEAYMLCSVTGDLKIVQAVDMPHYGVLYIYPVKALCGIRLDNSEVGGQGLQYDRTFMICRVEPNGDLIKIQGSKTAECALFQQRIVNYSLRINYNRPEDPLVAYDMMQDTELEFPLEPDTDNLERAEINLHQSLVSAYRMGAKYDDWFTACLGFKTALLYIGQERRPVLGTFSPRNNMTALDEPAPRTGWLSSISSYMSGAAGQGSPEADWLTFSDCAPLLVTTEASLRNVCTRVASGQVDMLKFRPNIVVDGAQEWDEDFWAALSVNGKPAVLLTKMCNRCTSLNIDYRTGRFGTGEQGQILKLLMKDRRVDEGFKYAPVFGRYGFLDNGVEGLIISVGDEMLVTKRTEERPRWDWPMNARKGEGRYYRYS